MKRLFPLFLVLFFIFCGCKGSRNIDIVSENLSFTATVYKDGNPSVFNVKIDRNGSFSLEQASNDKGYILKYRFSDDKVTVCYGKLEHTSPVSSLGKGNIIAFLPEVYKEIRTKNLKAKQEDNNFIISSKTENYDFSLYVGQSGLPLKLTDQRNNITIEFSNPTIEN